MKRIRINKKKSKDVCIVLTAFVCGIVFMTSIAVIYESYKYNSYENRAIRSLKEYQHNRYNITSFHCKHMTAQCLEIFRMLGLECEKVSGKHLHENNTYHSWVKVNISGEWYEFETTYLTFMEVSNEYEII